MLFDPLDVWVVWKQEDNMLYRSIGCVGSWKQEDNMLLEPLVRMCG